MGTLALFHHQNPLIIIFGLLGNFISFLVYFAPVPTFIRVYKRKSTEGFHCFPYLSALFSAMLWLYYAYLKGGATFLVTINSFGCVIETIYIVIFLVYATKRARILTIKLLLLMNLGGFCLILFLVQLLAKDDKRVQIVGIVCVVFSLCVFIAPLSVVALVIRTKSVEYMPFTLSFSLTLSAVVWFFYGLLQNDHFIVLPNVLGFIFGVLQMVLYLIYMGSNKKKDEVNEVEQTITDAVKLSMNIRSSEPVHPVDSDAQEQKEEEDEEINPIIPSPNLEERPNEVQVVVCRV
ncbi:bidirectional sugar transporter SWEET12-like [Macadamia integrifolia]|uniref:bidirectional sugar transporter SWEET12-like n=1 Tax=Macadamia integrifolia TaxID=60698 RepID=UPI001C4F5791|nr:bidirectional sugar transporter SWEET12-like [Macadamia integrifolia]